MKRERLAFALVSLLLLTLAAFLSRSSTESPGVSAEVSSAAGARKAPVRFPRDERSPRARHRSPAPTLDDTTPQTRARESDRIQRAMAGPEEGVVFVEVNALRHTPLVEQLLACRGDEASAGLAQLREQMGIDPLEDVDRLALQQGVVAMSGFFEELVVPEEFGTPRAHGDAGQLYTLPQGAEEESSPQYLARVGDDLLLLGSDEAALTLAVDRAEGRAPAAPPPPSEFTQGELYGTLGSEALGALFEDGRGAELPVAALLRRLVENATVRAYVDDAVSLSFDLDTVGGEEGEDLARAIGGAIAGARQAALREDDRELALLLDEARVLRHEEGKLGVDLAIPGDKILRAFGCRSVDEPEVSTAE